MANFNNSINNGNCCENITFKGEDENAVGEMNNNFNGLMAEMFRKNN